MLPLVRYVQGSWERPRQTPDGQSERWGLFAGGLVGPVTPGTSEVGTDAHLSSLFSPGLLVIASLLSGREKTVKIRLTIRQRASPILGNLGEGGLSLPGFGLN